MMDNHFINRLQTHTESCFLAVALLWFLIVTVTFTASAAERHETKVKPWLVKTVHFTGNTSINTSDLQSAMEMRPSGLFRKTKFSESLLNRDIETVAYVYRSKGFLDIQVKADDIIRDRSSRRVTLTIAINEGPQTRVDSMAITGCTLFAEAKIKRIIRARPQMPYSAERLSYGQQKLRDSIIAHGYPLCVVDRTDRVDSIAHSARVVFIIDQGPLAMAGPFTVNGAKRLRRIIVKRGLTFRVGDTLTTRQIQQSVRQMYETGMFKYVQMTIPVADSVAMRRLKGPVTLPVQINIEESDFYKYQGGVGYGTYEGVRVSLQTSYGNVLGLGRTIGLDGKYSRLIQGLHLHYTAPWFLLLPPTAELEVYGEHHDEVTFKGYLEGLTASMYAKTPWNLGYRAYSAFEWVHGAAVQTLEPTFAPMVHANNTQSFGTGFIYDIRDNIFDPAKGMLVTTDEELAGLIGAKTNHFYKFIMDARGYFPVTRSLNAATAATVGYVNGYGIDKDIVPPQELFYAGSETIRSVRGYAPGGVGDAVGGRLVLVLNVIELRFAIAKWLKIAGFVDAGYVWTSPSLFNVRDLRWTAGPGLRIRSPVGLLSTDLGVRLYGPTRGVIGYTVSIGEPF